MSDLETLLSEWAELCPDECRIHPAEPEREAPVRYGFRDPHLGPMYPRVVTGAPAASARFDDAMTAALDEAQIIGAVVYHVARRGYQSRVGVTTTTRGWAAASEIDYVNPALFETAEDFKGLDGSEALRAVAVAALSSYLSAVRSHSAPRDTQDA